MIPHRTKLHCGQFISNSKVSVMVRMPWYIYINVWFLLGAKFTKIKRYGLGAEGVSLGGVMRAVFCVNLTQPRVIREGGASVEEMTP